MLINKDPYLKQQFCYVPSNKTTFALKWYLLGQKKIANSKDDTCLPNYMSSFFFLQLLPRKQPYDKTGAKHMSIIFDKMKKIFSSKIKAQDETRIQS